MRKASSVLLAGLALVFTAGLACGTTYYVATNGNDSWPGSSSQPWLTLQHAADTMVAGDTTIVRNGTYAGFRATEAKSGSSGSPITFQAENTGQVTLNAKPSGAKHNGIIELEGYWDNSVPISYWVIDGFVIDGVSKTLMTLDTRWVDHSTFRNITAHHSSSRGLYISHGNYDTMEYCTSYSNGEHGSYQANAATYNTYRGNTCYNNTSCGFHNNGDLTGGGTGRVDYTLYEKNTAYGNPGKAFNCDGVCNSTFKNNLVYGNPGSGFALYVTDASKGSSDNLIYNNTVVMQSGGDWCIKIPSASYSGGSGDPTGNKLKNNIFTAPSGNGTLMTYSSSPTGFQSDYNVVMDSFSIDDGDSSISLATWRTYGFDTHSIISNPTALFVNPGSNDYHLKDGSPAINAGTTLSEVGDDKDGVSRPQGGAYDIGCYEKQQASSLNITTTSLPDGQIGVVYSQTLQATGGTTPYTWSLNAGSLPAGLSLSSGGVISGTPTTAGTSSFTVKVTDAVGATDTQGLSIGIPSDLVVTTSTLNDGQTGTAYSQTLAATGGKTPYSWSLQSGSLPAGLTLSSGGVISGTPTAAGTSNFTVRVTDSQTPADTATKALSIAIYVDLAVTTSTLNDGQISLAYSQTLAASGGKTPYSWSLQSGSLPAGLTLSSGGVISGTPTATGTSNFTVKVTDSESPADSATKALSIAIYTDLSVTTTGLNDGQIGTAYSQTLAASGGKTPYTWALASGTLPAGLSLSSGGVISGTPTTAGTSNFTVRATDSESPADTATKALSINIYADLTVTTASLPNGQIGTAYSQTLAASGGKTPYTWSLQSGSLPAGLSLSSGGVISGTPTASGTSNFTVKVVDSELPSDSATKALSIYIIADLVITTASLADGQIGTAYSQTLAATGGVTPFTWTLDAGSLPAGLTLSSAGVISGTPTAAGTSNFTVKVTDSQSPADTATKALSIGIYADLSVTTASLPNGQIGVAYSQTLAGTGGKTPYTWSLNGGSLPAGLSLSSGGVISGTPTASGTSNFTVKATDSESPADTATKALSIVIPPDLQVTTTSLPNGVVGTAYSQTLAATGGVTPYSWSLASGSLPAGLSLSSGGVISGTPTAAGTSNFTVRVTDSQTPADTATKALSIIVTSGGTSATYQFAANDSETSTTSTSYVNKTTMSFTPSTSDDWIVFASAEMKESSTSYQTGVQLTIDGAVAQDCLVAPKTTSDYHAFTAMKAVTLSASSHTMNIDYKTSNASGTAYIRNARIVAIRKASLELYSNDGGDSGADLTTTMTDYATVSWTCPASSDYLLIWSCSWSAATTSYYTSIEGRLNGGALDLTTVVANNTSNHYTFLGQKTAWCDVGVQETMTLAAAKQSGSSAVHHLERARVAAFNLGTGRFSGFVKNRDDSESTTTSTAWQQKLTTSVSVSTAANWFIVFTCRLTNTSTSYASEYRLQLDNTTTEANQLRRPQNTADYFQCGGVDVRNLSTGSRVFDVDYRTKNASGTAKIKNAHFIAIPLE